MIDEVYPLYLSVANRAPLAFGIFSREYFVEAGKHMPGRHRYFVWRRNGKVIAFNFCTIYDGEIWDNEIGFDDEVTHELNLYYRTFRDVVVWALQRTVPLSLRAVQLRSETSFAAEARSSRSLRVASIENHQYAYSPYRASVRAGEIGSGFAEVFSRTY